MSWFITGTDTNAGKTYVTSLLAKTLRVAGRDVVAMKPLCCGDRGDAETLQAACDSVAPLNEVNPFWLRSPAAPYTAAIIENRIIDLDRVRAVFEKLRAAHSTILVEGVGGWRVPILRDYFVSDLAAEIKLPVLVVARNELGAINQTLLTVESICASGLQCDGVILNNLPAADSANGELESDPIVITNRAILEELLAPLHVPILFEIEPNQTVLDLANHELFAN